MKILFGQKYYGKSIQEVPSGFLVWIIEQYKDADWLLINECKKELSKRLKLDWQPPIIHTNEENKNLKNIISHLQGVILLSVITRNWNPIMADLYITSPELTYSELKFIASL